MRTAALCLGPLGRLSDRLVCGPAVRGGLLLDLALAGRVEQTDESIVVDPTPVGFDPADRLLAAIAVEPERSLDGWLDERRLGLRDVVDAAVSTGSLGGSARLARPRAAVHRPCEHTHADRRRTPAGDPAGWTPTDAGVSAVAAIARLLARGRLRRRRHRPCSLPPVTPPGCARPWSSTSRP